MSLWNLEPHTHVIFKYDRHSVMKKNGDVLLYIPVTLAPKSRDGLNLFNSEKNESVWVECKSNFNVASK